MAIDGLDLSKVGRLATGMCFLSKKGLKGQKDIIVELSDHGVGCFLNDTAYIEIRERWQDENIECAIVKEVSAIKNHDGDNSGSAQVKVILALGLQKSYSSKHTKGGRYAVQSKNFIHNTTIIAYSGTVEIPEQSQEFPNILKPSLLSDYSPENSKIAGPNTIRGKTNDLKKRFVLYLKSASKATLLKGNEAILKSQSVINMKEKSGLETIKDKGGVIIDKTPQEGWFIRLINEELGVRGLPKSLGGRGKKS